MDVSVIIVSYNTRDLLIKCIGSIYKKTKGITYEIIVVDNNSKDKSTKFIREKFPEVKLIQNEKNIYFSKANNQGAKLSKGKYLLFLAPDSYLKNNSLKIMQRFLDKNKEYGACEGLEVYKDGKEVPTGSLRSSTLIDFFELSLLGKKIKNKKRISKYRIKNKKRINDFDVDVVCDAFLMIRRDLFFRIGQYNTGLKLYYTENDLCRKVQEEGYKIKHLGKPKIVHLVSVATNKMGWEKNEIYYKDLLNYYKKSGYFISGHVLYILLKLELIMLRIFRPNMFEV